MSKTFVQQTIRKYNDGSVVDKQRSGRPRVTTPRGDRALAVIAKKNGTFSIPSILREYQDRKCNHIQNDMFPCASRTRTSFVCCTQVTIPDSSFPPKNRRLWCRQKLNWGMERWNKVLFSAEFRLQLFPNQ